MLKVHRKPFPLCLLTARKDPLQNMKFWHEAFSWVQCRMAIAP